MQYPILKEFLLYSFAENFPFQVLSYWAKTPSRLSVWRSSQTCLISSHILSLGFSLGLKTQVTAEKLCLDVGGCQTSAFQKSF